MELHDFKPIKPLRAVAAAMTGQAVHSEKKSAGASARRSPASDPWPVLSLSAGVAGPPHPPCEQKFAYESTAGTFIFQPPPIRKEHRYAPTHWGTPPRHPLDMYRRSRLQL